MSKVIAVIDKPKDCQKCVFGICKHSLPLSVNRKGYYCQLLPPEQRKVQDFDYDAEAHLENCPLVPMPEKIQEPIDADDVGRDYSKGTMDGFNLCIDAITGEREGKD